MTFHRNQKNWLEWVVFGAGLILVLPLLGYLAFDAWTRPEGHPILNVHIGEPVSHGTHFGVPVTVTNAGAMTAADVLIEVTLEPGEGKTETAQIEVDFVPRQAERKGWAIFRSDPKGAKRLEARVSGLREP